MGATGKAKAVVKPSIVKAKLKGNGHHKGQANVEGKADGQDQDQDQPQGLGVGSKISLGWTCTQPGQPMGKLGSQGVKYELQASVAKDIENSTTMRVTKVQ